jgi:hypothetical protein
MTLALGARLAKNHFFENPKKFFAKNQKTVGKNQKT